MLGFAQMLHCCYEAFGSWVQEVFWKGTVVFFAPCFRFFVFFGRISCGFTKAYEPYEINGLALVQQLERGWHAVQLTL
jgi:hypothetical protein